MGLVRDKMVVTHKQKEAILTAIRVLRSRRVRPSSEKISWYVRRENLVKEETTVAILGELVNAGEILRVEYKGAISYRLTTEVPPRSKYDGLGLRRAVLNAISNKENGLTNSQISGYLYSLGVEHTLDRIGVILQREIRSGTLIKEIRSIDGQIVPTYFTPGNHLKIQKDSSAPASPSDNDSADDQKANSPSVLDGSSNSVGDTPFEQLHRYLKQFKKDKAQYKSNDIETPGVERRVSSLKEEMEYQRLLDEPPVVVGDQAMLTRRGRPRKPPSNYQDLSSFASKKPRIPSQRMKRARKVFDPSEANGKKRPLAMPVEGFQPITLHRCDVCYQTVPNGIEELLVCHCCSAKAHPSCLGYNAELAVKSRMGPWTCMDCKHCAICNMDHNIGTLIFCDKCDRAYHLTCHHPPLDEQPHGSWICFACDPNASQDGYDFLPGLPTPSSSPTPDDESPGSNSSWENLGYDPQIPNAMLWTVDNVVQYFKEKGFEKHCHVFKEQDIDGTALLMLTRLDVLTGLNMKLGPALKIHKQVRILQTRCVNPSTS